MNNIVSVIVPVYNTEKYLEQCIKSICDQTYSDLDIILITEKCDDNSEQICDEMAKLDNRIRVVHKGIVSGVSRSRNIGLKMARGKYILFVDSDDYIGTDRVAQLIKELENSKADILIDGKTVLKNGKLRPAMVNAPVKTVQFLPEAFKYILGNAYEQRFAGYVWAMFIPIETIKNIDGSMILFDENITYAEDIYWVVKVLMKCKSIYFSDSVSYIYRRDRPENTYTLIHNGTTLKYANSAIVVYTNIYRLFKKNNFKRENNVYWRIILHKIQAYRTAILLKDSVAKKKYAHNIIPMLGHYVITERSWDAFIWSVARLFNYIKGF